MVWVYKFSTEIPGNEFDCVHGKEGLVLLAHINIQSAIKSRFFVVLVDNIFLELSIIEWSQPERSPIQFY